jgi:predicted metal-dependent hydrolase
MVKPVDALWHGSIDEWSEGPAAPRERPLLATEPPAAPTGSGMAAMQVEVVRSAKRRKSVSARVVDGRIVVRMPQWMSKAQEAEYVTSLVAKLERQRTAQTVDLPRRARELARRYDLPRPTSIRWVANQGQRWGSCTPSSGEIRISDRIAGFPSWVLDAVIVHELAHLVHLHHSPAFWELVHRYPKTERAYGFLIAKQLADDGDLS